MIDLVFLFAWAAMFVWAVFFPHWPGPPDYRDYRGGQAAAC